MRRNHRDARATAGRFHSQALSKREKSQETEDIANVSKPYRFTCKVKNGEETDITYDLVFAGTEKEARAEFSELQESRLKLWEAHNPRAKSSNLRGTDWFEILAVDELDDATLRESREGADLSTIPALQRLSRKSLVIRPADSPGCESGWVRWVLWDPEGHDLADKLKVVGCRGYMETPPQGGPWYKVSSSDGKIGVLLCQKHLVENFPDAIAGTKERSRVSRHRKVNHGFQRSRTE